MVVCRSQSRSPNPTWNCSGLPQPQALIEAEPQENPVGQAGLPAVAPPLGGRGDFGGGGFGQITDEPAAVRQDRLGRHRGRRALVQDLGECRRVVARREDRLFGHRLETDDLVHPAHRQISQLIEIGDPGGESGVHQPVGHLRRRQKQPREIVFGVFTARPPVRIGVAVAWQSQQRRAVGTNREAELSVERRIEFGQRLDVGLVQTVLEPATVNRSQRAPVHVVVDQAARCRCARPAWSRAVTHAHTLHARRNFSASSSGVRSPKFCCS